MGKKKKIIVDQILGGGGGLLHPIWIRHGKVMELVCNSDMHIDFHTEG